MLRRHLRNFLKVTAQACAPTIRQRPRCRGRVGLMNQADTFVEEGGKRHGAVPS